MPAHRLAELRWLGVRAPYLSYRLADWHESNGSKTTSPVAKRWPTGLASFVTLAYQGLF